MSNLGMYQMIAVWSKKFGGPANLLIATACAGYVVLRTGEGTVKTIIKRAKRHSQEKKMETAKEHAVNRDCKSDEGLQFSKGDKFKVLEQDGEAVLIEKVGADSNPYFVSAKFLNEISEFK